MVFPAAVMSAQIRDMNPKSWIRRFQKNSIVYLLQMAAFYHALSITMMYVGTFAIVQVISDYQAPSFPVSAVMTITSGPIEEILFFGLAYYLVGTPQAVLFTGAIWSVAHIFGTQAFQINTLGYVNFLIAIPHMFFSLRVWLSGRGWFAIVFHSAWNLSFLLSYCYMGIRECTVLGHEEYLAIDIFAVGLMASLISIISLLHRRSMMSKTVFRMTLLCSVTAFAVFEILLNIKYVELAFQI